MKTLVLVTLLTVTACLAFKRVGSYQPPSSAQRFYNQLHSLVARADQGQDVTQALSELVAQDPAHAKEVDETMAVHCAKMWDQSKKVSASGKYNASFKAQVRDEAFACHFEHNLLLMAIDPEAEVWVPE